MTATRAEFIIAAADGVRTEAELGALFDSYQPGANGSKPRPPSAPARFTPFDDFLGETFPEEEWLAYGIIPVGALFQNLGKPESYKSMAIQNLHVSLAYGTPWLGRIVKPMPSFYVSNEKRRRSVWERFKIMAPPGPRLHDITVIHRTPLRIDPRNEHWLRLVDVVDKLNAEAMVSLDTITSLAPDGFNENSGEDWAIVLEAMRMLTSLPFPATVLGSFHPSKAGDSGVKMSSRGHGSFDGEADGAMTFNRPTRAKEEGVIHARPKDGDYVMIPFTWDPETRLLVVEDLSVKTLTPATVVNTVARLGTPTVEEVRVAFGKDASNRFRFSERRVAEVLKEAVDGGLLARDRDGADGARSAYRYSVTGG